MASVKNSSVTQAAYRLEADYGVERPDRAPSETLSLPEEPVKKADVELGLLSLNDLEQIALANNPSIAETRAKVRAAKGKWVQVGLPPNPRLGYSGQQLGSGGISEQQGVYIEQEVIRGGKLRLNRAIVSQEISYAEQLLAAQRRRVLTDIRMGYYNVLCAQRRWELTEELVNIGDQATKAAERLLEKKEGSRRDLLQARIESKSALNLLEQARNQHSAAWQILAAVLGAPTMPLQSLTGQLDETAAEISWEDSLQRLISESPEISAAFAQVDRARWAVNRARVEAVPDVNVQAIVQDDRATGSSNGALLVSIPIPIFNRNQGGIRQAESELIATKRAAERVELGLQSRLALVFERYLTSRKFVENYRDGILGDAKESLKLTKQGYEAGELNFLNLLTAQRTYFQANLGYVEALCSMWAASTEIEGLLLTNSLKEGPRSGRLGGRALQGSLPRLPSMAGKL